MAKLYPPSINGTIPAFYGDKITVPYSMNRAVGYSEITGFYLKIKTVGGKELAALKSQVFSTANNEVTFNIDPKEIGLIVGQYYKMQLAYCTKSTSGDEVGYYSTVGVAKYTCRPNVEINGMTIGGVNFHGYNYVGTYSQSGKDPTEKMYSCRFRIYDEDKKVIHDSGDILHNNNDDEKPYYSYEEYRYPRDFESGKTYYIKFSVTTTNKMVVHTPYYRLMQRTTIMPEIEATLNTELNFDNGYVTISIDADKGKVISGSFLLSRLSKEYGWEELKRFNLYSVRPEEWSLRDYTVEQGTEYIYSLQQYNDKGIYSDRILSEPILADFEDAFLFDGTKQLKLRYNPKVSTYKRDILESKTDTIGSKYPFISRNGNVNYKEFNISALVSYKMDEEELFATKEEIGLEFETFDLTGNNISAERRFKNIVMDWISDGKPKLFRTPSEGNYIVRLMNANMSPTDALGRMLHTFSCSAYELMEPTADSINSFGLFSSEEDFVAQMQWRTVDLNTIEGEENERIKLNLFPAYSIMFTDVTPGTTIYVDGEMIKIGLTGTYFAETDIPFETVEVVKTPGLTGNFTFGYLSRDNSVFELITKISAKDCPCVQIFGRDYVKEPCVIDLDTEHTDDDPNILDHLQDSKVKITRMINMRFFARDIEPIYLNNGKYYLDYNLENRKTLNQLDKNVIYQIYEITEDTFKKTNNYIIKKERRNNIDIFDLFYVNINGDLVNVKDTLQYNTPDFYDIEYLEIGDGVVAELTYTAEEIEYIFEDFYEYPDIANKKVDYEEAVKKYKENPSDALRARMLEAHSLFICALNQEIVKYREDK